MYAPHKYPAWKFTGWPPKSNAICGSSSTSHIWLTGTTTDTWWMEAIPVPLSNHICRCRPIRRLSPWLQLRIKGIYFVGSDNIDSRTEERIILISADYAIVPFVILATRMIEVFINQSNTKEKVQKAGLLNFTLTGITAEISTLQYYHVAWAILHWQLFITSIRPTASPKSDKGLSKWNGPKNSTHCTTSTIQSCLNHIFSLPHLLRSSIR